MGFKTKAEEQAFLMGAILHGTPIPVSDSTPQEPVEVAQHSESFNIGTVFTYDEIRGQTVDVWYYQRFLSTTDVDGNGKLDDYYWEWVQWEAPKTYNVIEVQTLEELQIMYNIEGEE